MEPDLELDFEDEPDPELNRITNAIIAAAIAVHKALGPGFQESVYQNALAIEFRHRSMRCVHEPLFPVLYRGEQVGQNRLDFLVEDTVIVELKAVESLTPLFSAQVISYLKATGRKLALLINFNVRRLKDGLKRVAL
ncbi:MAG: GxxExxY protein [Bacillota bacterium]